MSLPRLANFLLCLFNTMISIAQTSAPLCFCQANLESDRAELHALRKQLLDEKHRLREAAAQVLM